MTVPTFWMAGCRSDAMGHARPSPPRWEVRCPSTPLDVRDALIAAVGWMETRQLSDDIRGRAELVLAEVCNNICEHAYQGKAQGHIRIRLRAAAPVLLCIVEDDGMAMPDNAPPVPEARPLPDDRDALPEGGFGWSLIKMLASDVRYCRLAGRNRLDFTVSDIPPDG
ncbi:MAG: ATP-binding protein [Qingshengfaniella sp.]